MRSDGLAVRGAQVRAVQRLQGPGPGWAAVFAEGNSASDAGSLDGNLRRLAVPRPLALRHRPVGGKGAAARRAATGRGRRRAPKHDRREQGGGPRLGL